MPLLLDDFHSSSQHDQTIKFQHTSRIQRIRSIRQEQQRYGAHNDNPSEDHVQHGVGDEGTHGEHGDDAEGTHDLENSAQAAADFFLELKKVKDELGLNNSGVVTVLEVTACHGRLQVVSTTW